MESINCMRELQHAIDNHRLIIPLLLAGYGADGTTPWPPPEPSHRVQQALSLPTDLVRQALAKRLYVDLRTPEKVKEHFPSLVNRIDSEVRALRAVRRLHAATGKVFAINRMTAARPL